MKWHNILQDSSVQEALVQCSEMWRCLGLHMVVSTTRFSFSCLLSNVRCTGPGQLLCGMWVVVGAVVGLLVGPLVEVVAFLV